MKTSENVREGHGYVPESGLNRSFSPKIFIESLKCNGTFKVSMWTEFKFNAPFPLRHDK